MKRRSKNVKVARSPRASTATKMRTEPATAKVTPEATTDSPQTPSEPWPFCVLSQSDVTVDEMRKRMEFASRTSTSGDDAGILVRRRSGKPHFWLRGPDVTTLERGISNQTDSRNTKPKGRRAQPNLAYHVQDNISKTP